MPRGASDSRHQSEKPKPQKPRVRPEYPGGDFPIFGALKLRSLFAMLDFVGKSIRLPEFTVDPDPRTSGEMRNPVRTLDIEVSDAAPRAGEESIRFQDQYYTIGDTGGIESRL